MPSGPPQSLLANNPLLSKQRTPPSSPISPTAVKCHHHIILPRSPSCYESFQSKKSRDCTLEGNRTLCYPQLGSMRSGKSLLRSPRTVKPQHSPQQAAGSCDLGSTPPPLPTPRKRRAGQLVLLSVILWHTSARGRALASPSRFSNAARKNWRFPSSEREAVGLFNKASKLHQIPRDKHCGHSKGASSRLPYVRKQPGTSLTLSCRSSQETRSRHSRTDATEHK